MSLATTLYLLAGGSRSLTWTNVTGSRSVSRCGDDPASGEGEGARFGFWPACWFGRTAMANGDRAQGVRLLAVIWRTGWR